MLKFFKYSGPIPIFVIFIILLLLKTPLLFLDNSFLLEELYIKVLSEKMLGGNFLYKDIIDSTPPFAALFYIFISFIFNSEIITFKIVYVVLLFIQALIFKSILNNNDILSEKGEIPTLIYILVHSILPDFYTLSPAFIANTFILIALSRIFKYLKSEFTENEIFFTGINLGIASMICSQSFLYFILTILTFIVFTRTKIRFYTICALGFLFPIFSIFTYYYLFDSEQLFLEYYLFNFNTNSFQVTDFKSIIFFSMFFIIILSFGIFISLSYKRFINYQMVCCQSMATWLVISFIFFTFGNTKNISNYVLLLPFVAIFMTNFFLLLKKSKVINTLFYLLLLFVFTNTYSFIIEDKNNPYQANFCNQYITGNKWNIIAENKKVAYFGSDINIYADNESGFPFLDANLSFDFIKNIDSYEKIIYLSEEFEKNKPELIIDDWNIMPKIFAKLPKTKQKYVKSNHYNLYERIAEK